MFNTFPIEVQVVKIHLSTSQQLHIGNMYIPPKHTTQLSQTEDSIISSMLTTITNLTNTIITADVNAHSLLWYSPTEDHRGELIKDILLNSNHITLNTNTPTCLSPNQTQQPLHQISLLLQQTCMTALPGRPPTPSIRSFTFTHHPQHTSQDQNNSLSLHKYMNTKQTLENNLLTKLITDTIHTPYGAP